MKSIRFILVSYFQQHFFGTLGSVLAFVIFFGANIFIWSKKGVRESVIEKSFDKGAADYVIKPYDADDLARLVKSYID